MNVLVQASTLQPFTFNLWQDVQFMLSYDFMCRAFLAGTLLSIVAGLVGYFVVLRHQVFASEALSDVAFTGALGGAVFGINPLISLLVTTIVIALGMGAFGERLRGRDVAVGTVLTWVLGLGVLFLSLFTSHISGTGTGFSGITVLFGNLLGISNEQLWTIALVGGLVAIALTFMGRPLLFASLDPDVAAARGVPTRLLGLAFMVLLAVTVSLATMAMGALLIFALLLLPAAVVQQLTTRPFAGVGFAVMLAVLITWLGIAIGFYTGYPSSACVSLLAFLVYAAIVGGRALYHRFAAQYIQLATEYE
jgi:zinc/manganese transport system permease protein